jgi:hypothetical protein
MQPKRTSLSVDFSGVEDRARGPKSADVPDGDYLLELVSADVRTNKDKKGEHVLWLWKIIKGQQTGGHIYYRTTLKAESLWSLRNLLNDLLGKDIPKKALNLDLTKYVGKHIGASLVHGSGDYSDRSEIDYHYPESEYNDLGGEEEEAASDTDLDDGAASSLDDDDEELETVDDDDL